MYVLRTDDAAQWNKVLEAVARHDVYHLPGYHRVAELAGEGTAHLFVYEDGAHLIALPLLVRTIPLDGRALPARGRPYADVTSVYGYPGPVASHHDVPRSVREGFAASLGAAMRDLGVVSVFSRLHPLLDTGGVLDLVGARRLVGHTVSMDLTGSDHEATPPYRKNHVRDIAALRQLGVRCVEDRDASALDDFIEVYAETMDRVGAEERYLFDRSYFENLIGQLGDHARLFHCLHDDEVICSAVITECRGIVQYHLGGTRTDHLRLAPMKLLFDGVRSWAVARGCTHFHLGGGVGGHDDGVYRFKMGFSDDRHPFSVLEWIVDADAYAGLCDRIPAAPDPVPGRFPAYRR